MDKNTVLLFSRYGLGHAPEDLQLSLVNKFLALTLDSGELPAKILFYTEGVKLVCQGSPVVSLFKMMEDRGVELVICKTCLDFFGMTDMVAAGVIGGMPDIIEVINKAPKIISL